MRPREVAGEEPVRGPLPQAANRHEPRRHLLVGQALELAEVEVAAGEAEHVLGLARREAGGEQLVHGRGGDALALREGVRVLERHAVALDEPAPDRGRRLERDLLGGDRGDEGLERVRLQRRPVAAERLDDRAERPVAAGPGGEAAEVERQAEEAE
ncbi:MAG TPA: hypothetical protein VLS46_03370 [Gaiellaceae bacterium]|nr:hypothetical protein [Gaiellaceae bacterium]